MLLTSEQVQLLLDDVDYILPRTSCDSLPLTKSRILREIETDPDILLDLVAGMSDSDARALAVPFEKLRALAARRARGAASGAASQECDLFTAFAG